VRSIERIPRAGRAAWERQASCACAGAGSTPVSPTTRSAAMAKMTEPKELLVHELGDLLYAERRFLTATRKMSREANDPTLKQRIEQHVEETERQIERLQSAFEAIGEKAKAEKCEAAIGLREEHDS